MAKSFRLFHRFSSFIWSALSYLAIDVLCLNRAWHATVRFAEYVASAGASLLLTPVIAQWRIVESVCSKTIREQVNTFGQRPRSTGALNSPLL